MKRENKKLESDKMELERKIELLEQYILASKKYLKKLKQISSEY